MSCCLGEGHDGSQAAADTCCAMGEQRRHSDTPLVTLNTAVSALAPVLFERFTLSAAAWLDPGTDRDSDRPVGSRPHTHLLLSVFLI